MFSGFPTIVDYFMVYFPSSIGLEALGESGTRLPRFRSGLVGVGPSDPFPLGLGPVQRTHPRVLKILQCSSVVSAAVEENIQNATVLSWPILILEAMTDFKE